MFHYLYLLTSLLYVRYLIFVVLLFLVRYHSPAWSPFSDLKDDWVTAFWALNIWISKADIFKWMIGKCCLRISDVGSSWSIRNTRFDSDVISWLLILKHILFICQLAHQATVTFGQLSPIGKTKSRKGVLTILRPSSSSGSTVQTLRLLFFHGEVRDLKSASSSLLL